MAPKRARWLHPFLLALVICAAPAHAQSTPELQGRWEGTLAGKLRLVVEFVRASDGLWLGKVTSVDQGNAVFSIGDIAINERTVAFAVPQVRGTFRGEMDAAGSELTGTWAQGMPQPLKLRKVETPAATAASPAAPPAPAQSWPFGTPVVVTVPRPPTAFPAAGRQHLVYELHITNFSSVPLELRTLDVLDAGAERSAQPLLHLERDTLIGALQPVGVRASSGLMDLRTLSGGSRAVAYIWVSLAPNAAVPKLLRHRLATGGRGFDAGTVAVLADGPPSLGAPLKGSGWAAGNGPDNTSGHRRALIPVDGRAVIAQRFAIDWVKRGRDGRTFTGKQDDNRSYHAYGSELLAVADGEIAAVHDGIPENVPGPASRAVPITLETVAGNYVILKIGSSQYAVYAHLQPGTLRVKTGDRVKRGQVLGLLGNSGNSTEPHLHFHVGDGPTSLTSEGIPYVHDSFDLYDPAGKSTAVKNELPLVNALVGFD
jgi:murein DD-endopeptidase MepM/ murein hydrolase activator NlpD